MKKPLRLITIALWFIMTVLAVCGNLAAYFLLVAQLLLLAIVWRRDWQRVILDGLILELLSLITVPILIYAKILHTDSLVWKEMMSSIIPGVLLIIAGILRWIGSVNECASHDSEDQDSIRDTSSDLKARTSLRIFAITTLAILTVIMVYACVSSRDDARVYDVTSAKNNDRIVIRSKSEPEEALSTIVGDNPVFDDLNYSLYQTVTLKDAGDGYYYLRAANGRYLCAWCHELYDRNRVDGDRFQNRDTMKWRFHYMKEYGTLVELDNYELCMSNSEGIKQYGLIVKWAGDDVHFMTIEKAPNVFNRIGVVARLEGKYKTLLALTVWTGVCMVLGVVGTITGVLMNSGKKEL